MTADEILRELEPLGSPGYKAILARHGVREPFFGVKIEALQKIRKRIKKDHQIALDLYATGNADAMYLAGLIAEDERMSREDLERWVEGAYCPLHAESTVAWVATGSPHGHQAARDWIESEAEMVAAAGWSTLSCRVSVLPDAELDHDELAELLQRVGQTIHQQPNRARYAMNSFVIAVGAYVPALTEQALRTAEAIGVVSVHMGDTACKVPAAADYIRKIEQRGSLGKKRKTAKC